MKETELRRHKTDMKKYKVKLQTRIKDQKEYERG